MSDAADSPTDGPPEWAIELRDGLVADPRVQTAASDRVRRDMPGYAALKAAEKDAWDEFLADISAVLTVYDERVEPENRGPWRDRLVEFLDANPVTP